MIRRSVFIFFAFFATFYSCEKREETLTFSLVDPSFSGLDFSNDLPINLDLNIFNYMYYYNGGGVATADLNNDGLSDLVFSSNLGAERVYLNQGGLKFKDISAKALVDGGPNSWTNGVAIADVNADGLLDIYLSQVGKFRKLDCTNKLFVCTGISEDGIPSYEEQGAKYNLDFKGFGTQAGFFDYDLDGDLDVYLMNHSLHNNGTFGQRKAFVNVVDSLSGDKLMRNDGNTFVDVTVQAGITSNVIGYGLGLAFGDVNNDGYPDMYIGNDFHENDYLYINQQNGTFKEVLTDVIKHTSRFSMGVDIADINNDGNQDIFSLDMLPEDPFILKTSEGEDALDIFNFKLGYGYNHQYAKNALQLNQGNGYFQEVAGYAGIQATDWSWSPLFFDLDMDGIKDLFVTNGIPKRMNDIDYIDFMSGNDIQFKIKFDDLKEPDLSALDKIPEIKLMNKFFKGNEDLRFDDLKNTIGGHKISYSNSAVYADFDNDGDYDVLTNNIDDPCFLYENKSIQHKSVRIKLEGSDKNKWAIGSRVLAKYVDKTIDHAYFPTRGFQSCMLSEILIPQEGLQKVTVIWPDRKSSESTYNEEAVLSFNQSESKPSFNFESISAKEFLEMEEISKSLKVDVEHVENPFVEFNRESLIPFSTSAEGPALAVGDVNQDGLEDFFIGSSKRKRNGLFLQKSDGTFERQSLEGLAQDTIYEEVDAAFTDIDKDGDLDLIIATGGNEYRLNSPFTTPLLYRNEGGEFKRDESKFKDLHLCASCVRVADFDADGDEDLFFGGRALPWAYGKLPTSYLLENDGKGNFSSLPANKTSSLAEIGFVKDAQWVDFDQNGKLDLVLALEWDRIKILSQDANGFTLKDLGKEKGWWNSITIADFDGDGDQDVFAGNLGLNTRFNITEDQELKMYYGDFDGNGVSEQVLTYLVGDREITFGNLKELQKQIPSLKKKYLFAKDFAKAPVKDLLGKGANNAAVFQADYFKSTLYINDGNQTFSIQELPAEMQWSSYYSALPIDIDKDGDLDILPGGNYHYCNVQMGRYDADNGGVLINENGKFVYRPMQKNVLPGQVKKLKTINIAGRYEAIIAAQNNDALKILKIIED